MFKKRYRKRKRNYNPKNALSLAKKTYGMVRGIKNTYRPEPKFFDDNLVVGEVGTSGLVVPLTRIAPGDGQSERNGAFIQIRNIQMRINGETDIDLGPPVGPENFIAFYRVILFLDRSPNGALPTAAQLLDLNTISILRAPRNMDYKKRFKVFKDKVITTTPLTNNNAWYFKYYKKLNKVIKASYIPTTGDIYTTLATNHIYLLVATSAAAGNRIFASTRVVFYDN